MATDDQSFPIDIHYNKLLDWLINRRHCEFKWHAQAREIQERVKKALSDLPQIDQLAELSKHESVNYFHCLKIFEILKPTEGESTTLFGQYSSPRLKEWWDILKLYEKKNVYLAECAQQLVRNVNYEISALKQQISKCQQTQRDCQRKEGECNASAAGLRERYKASCKDMAIQTFKKRKDMTLYTLG